MSGPPPLAPAVRAPRLPAGTSGLLRKGLPYLAILLAWQLAAGLARSSLLPGPHQVLDTLLAETASGLLPHHLAATLRRVAICFLTSMLLGTVLGVAMGRMSRFDRWMQPWLQTLLAIPAMVVAILAYVWLGLSEFAAILAVTLAKMPNVAVILRQGAQRHDRDLADMAQAFRLRPLTRLKHIILPELVPFLLASARVALSLVWKSVLLVELLGRSDGIGFQLQLYFQLLDISHILAYAISFMLVILLADLILLSELDRHAAARPR